MKVCKPNTVLDTGMAILVGLSALSGCQSSKPPGLLPMAKQATEVVRFVIDGRKLRVDEPLLHARYLPVYARQLRIAVDGDNAGALVFALEPGKVTPISLTVSLGVRNFELDMLNQAGQVLASASITITVVLGDNSVSVTLKGLPASLEIKPLVPQGGGQFQVEVNARDASGSLIDGEYTEAVQVLQDGKLLGTIESAGVPATLSPDPAGGEVCALVGTSRSCARLSTTATVTIVVPAIPTVEASQGILFYSAGSLYLRKGAEQFKSRPGEEDPTRYLLLRFSGATCGEIGTVNRDVTVEREEGAVEGYWRYRLPRWVEGTTFAFSSRPGPDMPQPDNQPWWSGIWLMTPLMGIDEQTIAYRTMPATCGGAEWFTLKVAPHIADGTPGEPDPPQPEPVPPPIVEPVPPPVPEPPPAAPETVEVTLHITAGPEVQAAVVDPNGCESRSQWLQQSHATADLRVRTPDRVLVDQTVTPAQFGGVRLQLPAGETLSIELQGRTASGLVISQYAAQRVFGASESVSAELTPVLGLADGALYRQGIDIGYTGNGGFHIYANIGQLLSGNWNTDDAVANDTIAAYRRCAIQPVYQNTPMRLSAAERDGLKREGNPDWNAVWLVVRDQAGRPILARVFGNETALTWYCTAESKACGFNDLAVISYADVKAIAAGKLIFAPSS